MLSHRTRNEDSGRALLSLKTRFRRWEAIRDAPTQEVEVAISAATWPEQKAPRIQGALRTITEKRGELSLEFLGEMEPEEAQRWLESLNGVGPKTSAAVLLFSRLHMPALPVDSHPSPRGAALRFHSRKCRPRPCAHAFAGALTP